MTVEGIVPRSETNGKTRGPYDYLLEGQVPEANMDPEQLRVFLDGINGYLAELDKLDLPPEYLSGINHVLDEQVSLAFGEKVTQHAGEPVTEIPGEQVPPIVCGNVPHPVKEVPTTENIPKVGNAPVGMPNDLWLSCVAAGKKTGVDPYILAAQMEKESQYGKALNGSPSAGDGLMQVEPSTRAAYSAKFQAKMGHAYNHGSKDDQIAMAAVILSDKGGTATNMLQKYNGGDNWRPGVCDSYGRVIKADEYASTVVARAKFLRG